MADPIWRSKSAPVIVLTLGSAALISAAIVLGATPGLRVDGQPEVAIWVGSELGRHDRRQGRHVELLGGGERDHGLLVGAVSVGARIPTISNGSPRRVIEPPTVALYWRARSEPRTVTLAPSSAR